MSQHPQVERRLGPHFKRSLFTAIVHGRIGISGCSSHQPTDGLFAHDQVASSKVALAIVRSLHAGGSPTLAAAARAAHALTGVQGFERKIWPKVPGLRSTMLSNRNLAYGAKAGNLKHRPMLNENTVKYG